MPRYDTCDCSFRPTHPTRVCAFCGGLTMERPEGRVLANSDTDPDTVAISNLRVWEESHADTKGDLWVMRHGFYGSRWVEIRPELLDLTPKDALYRRAERLGLTGLTSIVDDLCRLEQYPVLDDDDHSKVEREEETEHWEDYGRADVRRSVSDALEWKGVNADFVDEMSDEDFDTAYWDTCRETGQYPEKIDSSAYDFGNEARYGREPRILPALVDTLAPEHGPLTVDRFIATLRGDEKAVWEDWAEGMGLVKRPEAA
jgi:hypothetical protein